MLDLSNRKRELDLDVEIIDRVIESSSKTLALIVEYFFQRECLFDLRDVVNLVREEFHAFVFLQAALECFF